MELTARRTLSFLSGGDLVPLLGDILYPSEKELLAERYGAGRATKTNEFSEHFQRGEVKSRLEFLRKFIHFDSLARPVL